MKSSEGQAGMAVTNKTGEQAPDAAGAPPEQVRFSAEELQAVNAELRRTAPAADTGNVLRLLPASPWRAFAFWSATAEAWEAARLQLPAGGAPAIPVLRFFDFTPLSPASRRPHPPFDVEVEAAGTGAYVDVWKDGKTYVAELGLLSGDRFAALARSNPVDLPPAGPSPELGFEWRAVSPPAPAAIGPAPPPRPAPDLFRPLFPRRPADAQFPMVSPERIGPIAAEAEPLPVVTEADPWPSDPWPSAAVPAAPGPADDVSTDETVADGGFPLAPCGAPGAAAAEAAEATAVEVLGDPAALVLGALPAPEALPVPGLPEALPVPGMPEALPVPGLPEAPAVPGMPETLPMTGTPETPAEPRSQAPLPLESLAAVSSFCLGPAADFELNAELHVYGRTRPGATLSLFGRPVAVAPDGTFSVRRPLPNGALVLPVLLGTKGDGCGK